MGDTLQGALGARLRAILGPEPRTESELRRVGEEAEAWERILAAQLERGRSRLQDLTADTSSPLGDIVAEVRHVRELQAELDELRDLLAALDVRARELRATWRVAQTASVRPGER